MPPALQNISAHEKSSEGGPCGRDSRTRSDQPLHVLGVVGVDNPTDSFGEGRDDRVYNSDLVDASGGVRALLTGPTEELACPTAVHGQDSFGPEPRQHHINASNIHCALPGFDDDLGWDREHLAEACQRGYVTAGRRWISLSREHPPSVDGDECNLDKGLTPRASGSAGQGSRGYLAGRRDGP